MYMIFSFGLYLLFSYNQYADAIYGPEHLDIEEVQPKSANNYVDEQSIEEALKKEVENLKSKQFTERRFKAVKTKVKNVLFIKTTLEDPNNIVDTIFNDIEQTKLKKTRYVEVPNFVKVNSYALVCIAFQIFKAFETIEKLPSISVKQCQKPSDCINSLKICSQNRRKIL